ncbi:hypothetical protein [Brachyspira hyodysenteriae]|uniref:Lipoprotein n=2 Tax=Brachyspira hyodysenteriae TaxID=159 RepID=A0A3B6VB74_BRAHW|nr:hypothetical protein [Brachyspira hyodysenteriae]ACN84390.1 hypothetical protein BHWA1_01927 [Brachyspira hyodysenteriae WA1]ANN63527.1 hypothetical protein BHYOB78_06500 [Brachyspira hyodysenteriae ATCC 27164]KLI17437.1 hypothetical protein SU44_03800 [Brachyspira hyodysenteriae]KLI27901.1 hypothetical protein SZ47_03760 [Brachyspira hyodysenteriae]KLI45050.1 hypothetical protein SZ53_02160 [Brachyspira hyodysenteriae]
MKKKIFILLFILLFFISCLPRPLIVPAKVVTELSLGEDIGIYSNEFVDLDSPKIYKVDNEYYFGEFYRVKNDTVYALDLYNSRMVIASGSNVRYFPLEYKNLETSKISLIDSNSNIYITGYNLRYVGDVVVSNVMMSLPSESPSTEGDDAPQIETYTVKVTNTNYTKVGLVSLNKISPEGNTLYSIDTVIDNEYESLVKLLTLTNHKFAILKRDKDRIPLLDIYDMNSGKMENRYSLKDVEYMDAGKMSYREIVDCVYVPEKEVLAILTMNIVEGKHQEDIIYTSKLDDFKLKESYKIPCRDNSLAVGISSTGRVTYTGMDNGMYFFIKTNPFLSQNHSKEYLGTDGFTKLRGIHMFDDSVYGFMVENGVIKFHNY